MLGNLLYFMFPFPPIVWRLLSVMVSVYIAYRFIMREKMRTFEKLCYAFVGMNFVYFFASFLWMSPAMTQIGNIMCAMLAFPTFIYLGRKGVLTERFMLVAMVVLTACSIPVYFHMMHSKMAILGNSSVTVNASTYFLLILPLCILFYRKKCSLIVYIICMIFIMMSGKRGNLVGAAIPSIFFLYLKYKDAKKSFLKLIPYILGVCIGLYYGTEFLLSSEQMMLKLTIMMEGDSSGRDVILSHLWNVWYNSNDIISYIFGYGYDGTLQNGGMYAHNDWMELLICSGLIGVVAYLAIFFSLFSFFLKRKSFLQQSVLISICTIWLLKTLVSMGYTDDSLAFLAIPLAYIYTQSYNKQYANTIHN